MNDDSCITVGTIEDDVRTLVSGDEQQARWYLRESFLARAADTLWEARRRSGLTQTQLAERLNTKQSAIARLEGDTRGSMSLRTFVDFLLACDVMPHDIAIDDVEKVRRFAASQPDVPRTSDHLYAWQKAQARELKVSEQPELIS